MIPALLLALSSAPETLDLVRGARPRPDYVYWAVEDTTLDSSAPDEDFGGSQSLIGGSTKTILIRFGDLERAIGPNKRVKAAKLILTPLTEKPILKTIDKVSLPWNEGPLRPQPPHPVITSFKWTATWRSRRSGEVGTPWQQMGASGPTDAEPISGTSAQANENDFIIQGLGPTIERMRQRWYENHGLALRFTNPTEFYSSQSQIGRPRLVLELEDATRTTGPDLSVTHIEVAGDQERTYTAHIKNTGTEPSKGLSATWLIDGRAGASVDQPKPLAPNEETTVTLTRPYKPDESDHRSQPLVLRITPQGPDANPSNDAVEIQESGFAIDLNVPAGAEDWAQSVVREWNDVYCPQSRYSFAPDGARERVRINRFANDAPIAVTPDEVGNDKALLRKIGLTLGLADLSKEQVPAGSGRVDITFGSVDPYAGIMGGGDTRYEGVVPPTTWLPYEPRAFEPFDVFPPEPTGLLSATDVATLNANLGKPPAERKSFVGMPRSQIVKAFDSQGTRIPGVEMNFFPSIKGKIDLGSPAFTVSTNAEGFAVLPNREGGLFGDLSKGESDGVLLVRAQKNGTDAWAWLKVWQFADAFARGNAAVVIAELPFDLPGAPIEAGTNLATNRIVTDSANSAPTKLASLLDEDASAAVGVPGGKDSWVEIDLGRDRTIGEIQIFATAEDFWPRFDIVAYGTGQSAANATSIQKVRDWRYVATNRSEILTPIRQVAFRCTGDRYRFIRLVNRSTAPGKLNAIRVVPAKVAP